MKVNEGQEIPVLETLEKRVSRWLRITPGLSREWLGKRFHRDKRTVDNWLSSSAGIPDAYRMEIETMMLELPGAQPSPAAEISIPLTRSQWSALEKAAEAKRTTATQYCIDAIAEACEADKKLLHMAADDGKDADPMPEQKPGTNYRKPTKTGNGTHG